MTEQETAARIAELRKVIDEAHAELIQLTQSVNLSALMECKTLYQGELGNERNLIPAIRHYRGKTGAGLVESKDVIEEAIKTQCW